VTDYADLEKVNALYMESRTVAQAITAIDRGGTLSSLSISPPQYASMPPAVDAGLPGDLPSTSTPVVMMTTTISIPGPVDPALLADVRALLVEREQEIAVELKSLGVSVTPPARQS
jgi:hypothetical protein